MSISAKGLSQARLHPHRSDGLRPPRFSASSIRGTDVQAYSQDLPEGAPRQRTPELQFLGMLRPHFAVTQDASWVAATPAGTWKIHIYDAAGKDLGEARGTTDDDVAAAFLGDRSLIVGPRQGRLPLQFYLVNTDTGMLPLPSWSDRWIVKYARQSRTQNSKIQALNLSLLEINITRRLAGDSSR